jgi:diketogulonate reductase-like aldo/keto reductase
MVLDIQEIIGQAIKHFERSTLTITTKVFKTHLHYDDVILACHKSLERLQTNYIDIYLIHAPNPAIPIKETMAALNYLIEQ